MLVISASLLREGTGKICRPLCCGKVITVKKHVWIVWRGLRRQNTHLKQLSSHPFTSITLVTFVNRQYSIAWVNYSFVTVRFTQLNQSVLLVSSTIILQDFPMDIHLIEMLLIVSYFLLPNYYFLTKSDCNINLRLTPYLRQRLHSSHHCLINHHLLDLWHSWFS